MTWLILHLVAAICRVYLQVGGWGPAASGLVQGIMVLAHRTNPRMGLDERAQGFREDTIFNCVKNRLVENHARE